SITSLDSPPLHIAWSPDGVSIAFIARVQAESADPKWAPSAILPFLRPAVSGYLQIFVVPATGGPPHRVTHGNFDCFGEPVWMPDGRTVLAVREGEIAAFSVTDGAARALVKGPGRYANP